MNLNSRWLAVRRGAGALLPWLLGRPRFRERERSRVRRELQASIAKADGFINSKQKMLDLVVLEWDFGVRSVLRQYLGPEAMEGFARASSLDLKDASDVDRSAEALKRARDSLTATIRAMDERTGIFIGGFTRAWLFRAATEGGIMVVVLVVGAGLIWLFGFRGDGGAPTTASTNSTFNTKQDLATESGPRVEVAATATTGPGLTPTVPSTPLSAVSLPDQPPLDIPAEPEVSDPGSAAETLFNAGVEALERQDFQIAVTKFVEAVETAPGFVRAYYNLGVAYEGRAMPDDMRAAVESYTAAIDLWNSLEEEDDGLLFQAKLARGLLLVSFASGREDICLGRLDLLDVLARGEPSPRNEEAINRALAQIEISCETPGEMTSGS